MLRLLHTADWHLGHTLHGASREYEHARFLAWLVDTLEAESADALIVAGDVFESANPPASAQRALYQFLAACHARMPQLEVVIIAGNHDSPARLEAPSPILSAFRVHTLGVLPRTADGDVDMDRVAVPLHAANGEIAAWCAAIPYLRPQDLPIPDGDADDAMIAGVRKIHDKILAGLSRLRGAEQALIATGHCYMVSTRISELSERKVLGGNQHALPADIFSDDLDYVALGHLHLAQTVGDRDRVRYSGSPLPLSVAEAAYHHQVLRVDVEAGASATVEPIAVPRAVEILRLGADRPQNLDDTLKILEDLDLPTTIADEERPFMEVTVFLDRHEPALRHLVTEALADAAVRLLRIAPSYPEGGSPLADTAPDFELGDLQPQEVFSRRYEQRHGGDPPAELLEAFFQLVESVHGEDG
jgi:exonuclease SbcD